MSFIKDKIKEALQKGDQLAATNRQMHSDFKRGETTAPVPKKSVITVPKNSNTFASKSKYTKDIDVFIGDLPRLEYDFIALHFKIANEEYTSACALGIAAFKGDVVVHNSAILIDPCEDEWIFEEKNEIRKSDVVGAPTFSDIFIQLYPLLRRAYVVAHNARRYDNTVLESCAKVAGHDATDLVWADSHDGIPRAAKEKLWNLPFVASKLGLPLDHAFAGSCAKVAGQIWVAGMAEERGSNRVTLPKNEVREWPASASLIVPKKVKIRQTAFDRVEADFVLKKYGSIVSADLTRWKLNEKAFWSITVGNRQIGSIAGSSAKIIDGKVETEFTRQRVNVSLRRHGYWEDGSISILDDTPPPKGYDKAPLRLPPHSVLKIKIDPANLKSIIDQIRGGSKALHIKEVGNVRAVGNELAFYHDDIFVGNLDITPRSTNAKKFFSLCAEGYLPMIEYYIELSESEELVSATVHFDLRWR